MAIRIAFRVDASVVIGTGHVMRCLTLAEDLTDKGAEVLFICRSFEGSLERVIRQRGFDLVVLDEPEPAMTDFSAEPLAHTQWLGVYWQQDAQATRSILQHNAGGWDWLIVDHYAIDDRWHRMLRQSVAKIMVIDDLADRDLDCDLLLDQNYYLSPQSRYQHHIPPGCRSLLGPQYALLRKEFTQHQSTKSCDPVASAEKRIFIFMGGADASNETEKALLALDQVSLSEFTADVVVSSANPRADRIEQLCAERAFCRFHKDVSHIGALMLQADLAIGAGGATTLERCYCGLPSLVLVLAENQRETTLALDKTGALRCLGWYSEVTAVDLARHITELIEHPLVLNKMCLQTRQVFGTGAHYGTKAIINELRASK